MAGEEVNDVLAYFENQFFEDVTEYVSRGRALESAKTEDLKSAWIEEFRKLANAPDGVFDYTRFDDVQAELVLRKEEPPLAEVKDALDALKRRAERASANITPQAALKIGSDVDRFVAKARKAKKN
jgi:hypothetical protein